MIYRIVKMSFSFEYVDAFVEHYQRIREQILSQSGCKDVILLKDSGYPNVFFTYSLWESTEALDSYRNSPFFKSTWSKIKPWFAHKPEAWTTNPVK